MEEARYLEVANYELGVLVTFMYSGLVGGLPVVARVALLACVGELPFVVPLVVSCSGYCLLMHSSPSRLFITHAQ